MKNKLFTALLAIAIVTKGFGQFVSYNIQYPNSVDLFELYEISFTLPVVYSNPYDPNTVCIYAEFTGPDNTSYIVNAFYYEDYTFNKHSDGYEIAEPNHRYDGWRIRFTPNQAGTWIFKIRGFDSYGSLNTYFMNVDHTFSCTSVRNAEGFISLANSQYLKRDVVKNGLRSYNSFFPVGPNVAWYSCKTYCDLNQPLGIYYYEEHIDSLYNRANYMRIMTNKYQYLSLYGLECTQIVNNDTTVYFDSTLNQKDAAELDHIISYAKQHNIAIMFNFFNQVDFLTNKDGCNPSEWTNNPFHNILGLSEPCDFFSNPNAIRITKNLIRYIISRWGYATNIMCWELWNEVEQSTELCSENDEIDQIIKDWHDEMACYISGIDPFEHCISSSVGDYRYTDIFQNLDIVQQHNYQDIQIARSRLEIPFSLYIITKYGQNVFPSKPIFTGEFGFSVSRPPYAEEKDPKGVSLHNSLWSSLFSASIGPASFWKWYYLDACGMYKHFSPIMNFCERLPILSGTYTSHSTAVVHGKTLEFLNGIRTYYMIDSNETNIMGWSQDTAFAYQSLRWLTDSVRLENDTLIYYNIYNEIDTIILPAFSFVDSVPYDTSGYLYTLNPTKRPQPSSNDNTIILPITNQPVGSRYMVRWYDSETGNVYNGIYFAFVQMDNQGDKYVSFKFPSFIRNLNNHTVNNTFGDAVFVLDLFNEQYKRR